MIFYLAMCLLAPALTYFVLRTISKQIKEILRADPRYDLDNDWRFDFDLNVNESTQYLLMGVGVISAALPILHYYLDREQLLISAAVMEHIYMAITIVIHLPLAVLVARRQIGIWRNKRNEQKKKK